MFLTVLLGLLSGSVSCSSKTAMIRLERDPLRQKVVDSRTNLRFDEWSIGSAATASSAAVDIDTDCEWRVHKYVLHGGRQEGVDVVVVSNGVLTYTIVPSRGMDIWEMHCGSDFRIGWDAPVEEVVSPAFVNLDARGGLGWLEGFGAWMCRCGLASVGAPGTDTVASNTGAPVDVNLTLHGKISYLPASEVEVIVEPPPSRRIRVRGIVDESMMFGTNLRLATEIWTTPGSKTVTIEDEVINRGDNPQEMQLLYHANFGCPLLEEGAQFVAPVERVFPRDARATEGGMKGWNVYDGPTPGYVEQVYFVELFAGEGGHTETLLRDRQGHRGVSTRFSTEQLPCLTLWKNTQGERDGYVTGVEPGTSYPNPRQVERAAGRVPKLAGGESYKATLSFTALVNAAEVTECEARIEAIRAGREPQVDAQPE